MNPTKWGVHSRFLSGWVVAALRLRISPSYLVRFTADPLKMRRKSSTVMRAIDSNESDRNSLEGWKSAMWLGRALRLWGHAFWQASQP